MSETTRFAKRDKSLINLKAINFMVLIVVAIAALAYPLYWRLVGEYGEATVDAQLIHFAQSDPYIDVHAAIANDEIQFIALSGGEDLFIPGIDQLTETLRNFGYIRTIEPESAFDDLSPHDQAHRRKALIYLEAYNQAIRQHIENEAPRM